MSFFELQHKDKKTGARAGVIHTDHGDIETPIFMPVGTQATVKTLDSFDLKNIGAQIILGNNYHLHLRPGEDIIAQAGGLHKFMNWDKPILTDSGGFQVFSLGKQKDKKQTVIPSKAKNLDPSASPQDNKKNNSQQGALVKITDEGVEFRSHVDGSKHFFSPEKAIQIEHKIGADIIMAFDECTPDQASLHYARQAMDRTHRWAKRCINEHEKLNNIIPSKAKNLDPSIPQDDKKYYRQFLFGIIQGANHKELREESARAISELPFDGIAIGGESIGYNMKATAEILDWVMPYIPEDKPHYAMGVGLDPSDLITVVEHGVDMFDCVAPTRLARHGMLFVKSAKEKNRLNIRNSSFAKDFSPIDSGCGCLTCKNYTRAYLHHLFAASEMTAMRLASIHNLYFLLNLMKQTRQAILEDRFLEFKKEFLS